MIKELYRLRLVIFLAFIAVLMGLTRFRYRNYQWVEPQIETMITPTVMPTPTEKPQEEAVYPLINSLPYTGKGFVVESYEAPLTLNIVTDGNIKNITKEVFKWMLENKVATESHKLVFQSP
ncbi:MAG: hypothetical protein WC069_05490 [Candidatus Shapirobacteria bacterium]